MNDSHIQAQAYAYFLTEAPELLQTIEQEILTLPSERTTAKVHNLMRALHTLKGAAANVGLSTIEHIAHDFEDLTRVFYDLEIEIDPAIQSLLLDGYQGLQECLDAQIMDRAIDEAAVTERMTTTVAVLKLKLGDRVDDDIALPTAMELGFDIVASIFETTIQEQIEMLSAMIATHQPNQIADFLQTIAEIGIGLAESFELPGFLAIDRAIVAALSSHPDRVESIAALALQNLQQAQAQVLAGDRTSGGTVLPDLARLAQDLALAPEIPSVAAAMEEYLELETAISQFSAPTLETAVLQLPEPSLDDLFNAVIPQNEISHQILAEASGEAELPAFYAFLTGDQFHKRHHLNPEIQRLFTQVIRLCWDWFRQEIHTPHAQLNFEILVTAEGLADLDYLHHWINLLLQGVSTSSDRLSLQLYRQCCVYQVIFAVAKYLSITEPRHLITPEFLLKLRLHLQTTADTYHQQPPVTANERGWIDRIILPHHWVTNTLLPTEDDVLLSEIWGDIDLGKSK